MAGYRLYFLDGEGQIQQAAEFECAGDDEAMEWASEQLDGRAIELWSGMRQVIAIPAADD